MSYDISQFLAWRDDEFTQMLRQWAKKRYYEDSVLLTSKLNLRRDCESIALQMAEFKGRQQVFETLMTLDTEFFTKTLKEALKLDIEGSVEDHEQERSETLPQTHSISRHRGSRKS